MKYLYILLSMALIAGMPLLSQIQVEAPNGGEAYFKFHTKVIQWKTGNVRSNVRIRLVKGNTGIGNIVDSTPNDGQYEWKIDKLANGQVIPIGADYKVKIVLISNKTIKDVSDGYFSIKPFLKPGSFKNMFLPDLVITGEYLGWTNPPEDPEDIGYVKIRVTNTKHPDLKFPLSRSSKNCFKIRVQSGNNPSEFFTVDCVNLATLNSQGWAEKTIGIMDPSWFPLQLTVDCTGMIAESNECNNTFTVPVPAEL